MNNSERAPAEKVSESSAIGTALWLYKGSRMAFNIRVSKSNVELALVIPSNAMKGVLQRR
jgi:hypothetical protein